MNKNIVINASPCANASDVANYLEREFGLFHLDFSTEFKLETGYSEQEVISQFGYEKYSLLRSEVIMSLKENITQPSVIVLVANTVSVDELSQLGYLHSLAMSELPAAEVAEHIFDMAAEQFCGAEIRELLVA